ncbi:ammonium transporter [Candidatus Bathyarchaeota archaeon]|nr:ammonium transporter [Candidatus Bathyarchaeota archaeon]
MIGIDDSLDVFAEHGIGGIVGLIFNAFFAEGWVVGLDGVNTGMTGGFMDGNYKQLYIQLAYIFATSAYAFVMSVIIAKAIDMIPGLKLRASEEAELLGLDDDQHGEFSYDYVEVRRDFLAWSPQCAQQTDIAAFTPQLGEKELNNMHSRMPSMASSRERVVVEAKVRDESAAPTQRSGPPSEFVEHIEPAKSG